MKHDDTASESGRGSLSQELSVSKTTPNLKQPSVIHAAKDAEKKIPTKKQSEIKADLQCQVNHCIMCLICMHGLVPNVIDSSEWKKLLTTLNPSIHPISSSTFVNKHIPKEAMLVHSLQEDHIKNSTYTTISFDRTNTRCLAHLYMDLIKGFKNNPVDWSREDHHINF
ncbi:hypothetical protein HETIRDRAFT_413849 [Heterobasidion irregulare TC 32-1]|uniref:Uncharacterized protein n=1 Tax=Heterobasidion irregulare (strain TC 32-1) TaxID=747525 RepID=W4KQ57_HETIT|nr:uncharacterized protein HETIRDRAFT_413849 [Heterobasidion irregulare TC 32-1]ETW87535.1 hypothetical protein HETIRDRAFT_413849 [Heterobasidion irregulare TC 32-1]